MKTETPTAREALAALLATWPKCHACKAPATRNVRVDGRTERNPGVAYRTWCCDEHVAGHSETVMLASAGVEAAERALAVPQPRLLLTSVLDGEFNISLDGKTLDVEVSRAAAELVATVALLLGAGVERR